MAKQPRLYTRQNGLVILGDDKNGVVTRPRNDLARSMSVIIITYGRPNGK